MRTGRFSRSGKTCNSPASFSKILCFIENYSLQLNKLILVIDNYDSFVHNLARYFRKLGCETLTVRNDQIEIEQIGSLNPDAIVISPGPGTPEQAGISVEVVRQLATQYPILGVCLGHQAIVKALGGNVGVSGNPVHGRRSQVFHDGGWLFNGIPSPWWVGRYHSLVAETDSLPIGLEVAAWLPSGTVMAVVHRTLPLIGVQFHPESILTEHGEQILLNFLELADRRKRLPSSDLDLDVDRRVQPVVGSGPSIL